MFLRIMLRGLKREKTMNVILLVFILLATMFISGSVSNIAAIDGAVEGFLQKAQVPDLMLNVMERENGQPFREQLDQIQQIDTYHLQKIGHVLKDNVRLDGEQIPEMNGTGRLYGFAELPVVVFDRDDEPISCVEPGMVWISADSMKALKIREGQTLVFRFGGAERSFTVAGAFKDASMIGSFLVAQEDMDYFLSWCGEDMLVTTLCYIETSDVEGVRAALSGNDMVSGICSREDLEEGYLMDMIVAGVLLVVSLCLIVIAFVMLRFTISSAMGQELRQIGVLKAIGIPNGAVRRLYMAKYTFLAVIGALIGGLAGIPFGEMLLDSVSEKMVMEAKGGIAIHGVCAAAVVALTMLFCYGCTGKVSKATPVDAIRNGDTGERFRKKGILRLARMGVKPSVFMAMNDVLSSTKRFGTVVLVFAACLSLVLMLVISVNTLKSDKLISAFGMAHSDLYFISDREDMLTLFHEDGRRRAEAFLEEKEHALEEAGIGGDCSMEIMMNLTLRKGEKEHKTTVFQGLGTTSEQYDYYEDSAPQDPGEIAITAIAAQKLGVGIGDTVTIRQLEGDREYLVTALFQSMMNMGDGVRLHEEADLSFQQLTGIYSYQITFHDAPGQETIRGRKDMVGTLFHTEDVFTAAEYMEEMAGAAETVDGIRVLVLGVVLIIIVLVTMLMEQSFITKERSQIALLKALGIGNGTIIAWHGLRFGIVAVVASVISLATILPLTELAVEPVFAMMGADFGIEFQIQPLEVYVLYPALVLSVTMVSAMLTALGIRAIHPRECTGAE